MPCQVEWLVEDRVICMRVWERASIEELKQATAEIEAEVKMYEQSMLHLIVDLTDVTQPIPLVESAAWARTVEPLPQIDWTIRVGEKNPFVKLATSIIAPILGVKSRVFNSREEALAFLEKESRSIKQDYGDEG